MAKKTQKSRKSPTKAAPEESILDAEIVGETADADVATPDELEKALSEDVAADQTIADEAGDHAEPTAPETPEDAPLDDGATDTETMGETAENAPESPDSEPVSEELPAPEPDPEPVPEPTPAPAPAPKPAPQQSVFIPMLLGGIVAGVIGYGVAYMQFTDEGPTVTPADIEALQARISDLPPPTDISGLTADLEAANASLVDLNARIDSGLMDLTDRVTVLERQPNADGTLTDTALAAFESDMAALRDQLSSQQSEMEALLNETQAAASAVQANAVEAAQRATARAALARVQGALETGAAFGNILPELESALGGAAPEAIAAVDDGVPTLNALQTALPDAARAALAAARAEGVDGEESGGLSAFLRNQLNARSIQPQEGDSVDAILSRMEGAMAEGRLNDALAEAASLPDVAKAPLSDWLAQAEARAAALDAADTLANSLTD